MNTSDALKKAGDDGSAKGIYIDYGPQLSDAYGATSIDAIVVDPEKIFVYWEFSVTQLPTPNSQLPNNIQGPKTDDQSGDWNIGTRPAVMLESPDDDRKLFAAAGYPTGHHFFAAQPDRRYRAAIGFVAGERFDAIAFSDIVTTPRRGPSMEIDPEWVPSPEEMEILKRHRVAEGAIRPSSSRNDPGAPKSA